MQQSLLNVLFLVSVANALRSSIGDAANARELALEQTWSEELEGSTHKHGGPTPIQRVVALLNEMKTELEHEAEKDEELYDKMVCWCETEEKEKTKAVADAESKDMDLTAEIEERGAKHGVITTTTDATKEEVAEETKALAEASEMRDKDAAAFMTEEKEMVQAITNMKNAIMVLGRNKGLTQLKTKVRSALGAVLQDVVIKHELMLGDQKKKTRESLRTVLLSIQSSTESSASVSSALRGVLNVYDGKESGFDILPAKFAERVLASAAKESSKLALVQESASSGSKAPASSAILGILKQMKEEFEANLVGAQKDEAKGQEDFLGLKSTKEEQITAAKQKVEDLLQEFAANKKAVYDAKEDLVLTREQRSADVKYLQNLKTTCGDLDKQWEERSKMRSEEIKAVAETISIIMDDDAQDTMRGSSFLQMRAATRARTGMRVVRSRAAAVMKRAMNQPIFGDLLDAWRGRDGQDSPRTQLAAIQVSIQLDSFTKVKAAMDSMVAELKDQQAEEVKLKKFCLTELNENEKQTYIKTEERKDLEQKIAGLDKLMERLNKEIDEANKEIADTALGIKKASQGREEENAEFQTAVTTQRATQAILKKALQKLEAFYKKKSLLQESDSDSDSDDQTQTRRQTPPGGGFKPMKKSGGGSPVISMLEMIIEESVGVEAEAVAGEKAAQTDYEVAVKDGNALIKTLKKANTEKGKTIAKSEDETEGTKSELGSTVSELEDLAAYATDLHGQCDFVLKNFDARQKGRTQEIEAIHEAKAILSGASFIQ